MFNIICLRTDEIARRNVASAHDAVALAEQLTAETGLIHQPRRAKENAENWRERETKRFRDKTYTQVPWTGRWRDNYPDHFVHVSKKELGKVAFTEDEEKGLLNRKTRMRPGR